MVGRTISHYQVLEKIGEGGMGVVYKARDTHLNRSVALKVLPPERVADPERKRRFVQEAQSASALNHPNIVHIYDIDQQDGVDYIAMEHVQGKTLGELIGRKGLKLSDALKYGVEIADALSRAHAAGIVHRDLKPGNIMVDDHGLVKVLDFGLAKLTETGPLGGDEPTRTMRPTTEEGTIVGTVAYMSPEQAEGKPLDARSDIFSFGAVLYEMLTGRRAFQKESKTSTLAAIIHKEPEPLAAEIPQELSRVVTRCLRKDPGRRYQHMDDVKIALEELKEDSESGKLTAVEAPARPRKRRALWPAVAAATLVVLAAVGVFVWQHMQAKPLTDKDVLVLADFTNTTGDPVFDLTLRQALAVQLEQSPYLQILSDERARQSLRFMGRSPDERVTNPIAREICEREGVKAMLSGSIASLGKGHVIALDAVNCRSGETLAREQVEAEDKEHVLRAVGKAASSLRARLGESLSSIQKLDTPITQATTSSLEALKSFALGEVERRRGNVTAALPFYQRAVELDPNFALAYRSMGTVYWILGERGRVVEYNRKAFALLNRVSERERLLITSFYFSAVTGEVDKTTETLELLKRTYPRDWTAPNNLGTHYRGIGRFEKALEEAQEALRLDTGSVNPYVIVAMSFLALDRYEEAKAVAERAFSQKLDTGHLHRVVFWSAAIQGDAVAMERQVAWAAGRPEEFQIVNVQADYAETLGQVRQARKYRQRAIDLAEQRKLTGVAAVDMASEAAGDAARGNCAPARVRARAALALDRDAETLTPAAGALALCGEAAQAQALADELAKESPTGTLANAVRIPLIRAAVELKRNQPAKVIELLKAAVPYERAYTWVPYLRGLAYLQAKAGSEAAAEFQKILDHKGVNYGPLYPLAYVGLARAAVLAGDADRARKAYQDFLALWKDADPDIPILKEARQEYAKLK